nr:hypothetical protein Iba_chr01dCG2590 [Ipomoea batatas]
MPFAATRYRPPPPDNPTFFPEPRCLAFRHLSPAAGRLRSPSLIEVWAVLGRFVARVVVWRVVEGSFLVAVCCALLCVLGGCFCSGSNAQKIHSTELVQPNTMSMGVTSECVVSTE